MYDLNLFIFIGLAGLLAWMIIESIMEDRYYRQRSDAEQEEEDA